MSNRTPTLQQLLKALKTVENWFVFGAMLGVPVSQLRKIRSSCRGNIEVCKIELLQYWLDSKLAPKWNEVILALEQSDRIALACQIKHDYLSDSEKEGVFKPALESSATSPAAHLSSALSVFSPPLSNPLATDENKAEIEADVNVVRNLKDLEGSFGDMIVGVKRHLEKCDCDLREAKLFLFSTIGTEVFGGCDNFGEVLEKLQHDHIDVFNISILQQLVACLKKNHEQIEVIEIEAYSKKKESFLKQTTVLEFQRSVVSRVEPILASGMAVVTIKVPKKIAYCRTLKDIEELAMDGFEECHKKFIHLHADPGSIIISWVFPKKLSGKLEQQARDNATIFKDNGVLEVTVGGKKVFPCTQQEDTASSQDLPLNLSPITPPEHRRQHRRPVDDPGRFAPIIMITMTVAIISVFMVFLYPFYFDHSTESSSSLPHSLAEYQRYLRDCYSSPYSHYSESINCPEQPINLVLVRKERNQDDRSFRQQRMSAFEGNINKLQKQATSVNINQIGSLDDGKTAVHFVLIEGSPGVGKSTLCWQLCRLWREGKLKHEWDLMVIVELRDESTRKASNLYDLFYHPDDKTRLAIAEDIQKREGEGLFILLDGYDELSKQQLIELSIIQKILTNRLIPKATVVITSRPAAITALPAEFKLGLQLIENQHIEISGFNETDIQKYITLACGSNQRLLEDFRSYVSNNRFVLSVMYNPLHCTIVTELYIQYWWNGQKLLIPNTLTGIYNALVMHLLRRNLPANLTIKKLSDIPDHMNSSLTVLAELAANGLKEGRYIFSDAPNCQTLGLMVTVRNLYDMKATSYMFLHLTLQEYLAALYWSHHPHQVPNELQSFKGVGSATDIDDNKPPINLRWSLYLFLAGITKLDSFPLLKVSGYNKTYDTSLVCQLLFEAQSPQLVSEMFANCTVTIEIAAKSSLDSFVYGYCVANSDHNSTWYLGIFSNKHLLSFSDGMHYSVEDTADWDERYKPSITMYLYIQKDSMFFEAFARLYPFTKTVIGFHFNQDFYVDESSQELHKLFHYSPRVTSLELPAAYNSALLTSIFQISSTLTRLMLYLPNYDLLFGNITRFQDLTELTFGSSRIDKDVCLSFERNLPTISRKLKILRLEDIHITHKCVNSITQLLLNSSLDQVDFSETSFSNNDDLNDLVTAISNSKLKHLRLYDRSFNLTIANYKSLAKLLTKTNTSLEDVTVGGYMRTFSPLDEIVFGTIDCDVARVLVEAMAYNSGQNTPFLQVCMQEKCDAFLADISYPRDKVVNICRNL